MLIFICLSLITDDAHRPRNEMDMRKKRERERKRKRRRNKDRRDEEEKRNGNENEREEIWSKWARENNVHFICSSFFSLLRFLHHLLQFFFLIQFQIMTTSRTSIVNIHCPPSSSVHGWQVESGYYSDSYNNSSSSMSNNSKQHQFHTGNHWWSSSSLRWPEIDEFCRLHIEHLTIMIDHRRSLVAQMMNIKTNTLIVDYWSKTKIKMKIIRSWFVRSECRDDDRRKRRKRKDITLLSFIRFHCWSDMFMSIVTWLNTMR